MCSVLRRILRTSYLKSYSAATRKPSDPDKPVGSETTLHAPAFCAIDTLSNSISSCLLPSTSFDLSCAFSILHSRLRPSPVPLVCWIGDSPTHPFDRVPATATTYKAPFPFTTTKHTLVPHTKHLWEDPVVSEKDIWARQGLGPKCLRPSHRHSLHSLLVRPSLVFVLHR